MDALLHLVICWGGVALLLLLLRRLDGKAASGQASPLSHREFTRKLAEELAENLRKATQAEQPVGWDSPSCFRVAGVPCV